MKEQNVINHSGISSRGLFYERRVSMLTKRGLWFVSVSLVFFATFLMSPALSAELPPIKLGVNLPFSGFYAEEGKLAYEGAMLAIEDANAKGGIKGAKDNVYSP